MDPSFLIHSPAARQWQQVGIKHHHGLAVPLFSLYSAHSCGIGEFPDLLPLLDWCTSIGLDVVQLLPLNDTGWDTSPYNALSAFALNPIHIGLSSLPYLSEYPILLDELKTIPKLSHSSRIHYAQVRESKERFLRHYYQLTHHRIMTREDYHQFIKRADWLQGYALFKSLKSEQKWTSWDSWPEDLRFPHPTFFQHLLNQYRDEVNWHCFLQFLCDHQLQDVKKYATTRKVFLMGDIPILISRDSADVWLHRDLFDLNYSAGAPPDIFSMEGQNWGFPIYNWDNLQQHNFQWWVNRLKHASRYYHIYRIDHIVGFFRIWAIPSGLTGKEGCFIPADPTKWIDHGQKIMLMMLLQCDMLPIGEDLGVVPPEVRSCLNALGICGTKVMRWERKWKEDRNFIPIEDYPPDSMTTVSTHDSETIQLWWQNNPIEAKLYAHFKGWCYTSTLSRCHHYEILWDSHHSRSLFHINLLQEYMALIPGLTWPNLEDERINVPGSLSENNWSHRFRLSVEDLTTNQTLHHLLKEIIL